MEKEVSQFFKDYIPANDVISAWHMHESDLIMRAMKNQISFYYPVKIEKYITYYPFSTVDTRIKRWLMRLRAFLLPFGLDGRMFLAGQLIEIQGFNNLNRLGKKVLSESHVLAYCHDTDSRLLPHDLIRNEFCPIQFEDILIEIDQGLQLKDILAKEKAETQASTPKPKSKQEQREEVFLTWLANKDDIEVSRMKKDEVWEELRKLDQRLFGVEPKSFFRDQKIITFKSGRKPS